MNAPSASLRVENSEMQNAVEMTPRGKRGKLKNQKRVFHSSHRAWKSGKNKGSGFPHFHRAGGGRISLRKEACDASALGGRPSAPRSQSLISVTHRECGVRPQGIGFRQLAHQISEVSTRSRSTRALPPGNPEPEKPESLVDASQRRSPVSPQPKPRQFGQTCESETQKQRSALRSLGRGHCLFITASC